MFSLKCIEVYYVVVFTIECIKYLYTNVVRLYTLILENKMAWKLNYMIGKTDDLCKKNVKKLLKYCVVKGFLMDL